MSYGHRADGKLSPEPSFFLSSHRLLCQLQATVRPLLQMEAGAAEVMRLGGVEKPRLWVPLFLPVWHWAGYPSLSSRCLLYEMDVRATQYC